MKFDTNSVLPLIILQNVVLPADGEDKESVDGHVLEMQRELCKTRPNMVYVADAMARTFASRRLWVTTEHPTVAAVLSMYPAYQLGTIVSTIEIENLGAREEECHCVDCIWFALVL